MAKFERIRKRDGSLARFDEAKLERSIQLAAAEAGSAGRETPARAVADAVTTYLRSRFARSAAPSSEEIREMVRKVLVETGYPKVAEAYAGHARRGPPARAEPDLFPQQLIRVAGGTRDESQRWDRGRIAAALAREADLDPDTAERIAGAVEQRILSAGADRVSTAVVRELVNQELVREGRPVPLERQRLLGIPKADLREMLARSRPPDPDSFCRELGSLTLRQFALQEIYSSEVSGAHLDGRIHIHGLRNPLQFYWGRARDAAAGSAPGLLRIAACFSEAIEAGPMPATEAAGFAAPLAGVWGDRPRILLGLTFGPQDDPAQTFRDLDALSIEALRLDVRVDPETPAETLRVLAHRAGQRGRMLFSLHGPGPGRFDESAAVPAQAVSINLPNAWARARSEDRLFEELERAVDLAVAAHEQKRSALKEYRPAARLPKSDRVRCSIGAQGLAQLVRLATGLDLSPDEGSLRWATRTLGFVQSLAAEAALRTGLELALDEILSWRTSARFARIDARWCSRSGPEPHTPGFHAPAGLSVPERIAVEARLGSIVGGSVLLIPREERPRLSTEEFLRMLGEARRDRRIRRILVP